MTFEQDLPKQVAEEFRRLGFKAHTADITKLCDALASENVEYDELAIMAACIGYLSGKGLRFSA